MTTNPLGSGVTRYIDNRDRQFAGVVFQANRPPLDSELNLGFLVDLEARAEEVRSRVASGWLMHESNPLADFTTRQTYSNMFYFGRQQTGELRNLSWAVVNGWPIPVAGTRTGSPPLAANNTEYWNKIQLNPPSNSTGGNRAEFVFLEAWLARIDTDPAAPAVAPSKPQRGYIYRLGNVESGFSNLPDEIIDPHINFETSKRVQVQYRIRVVSDVNLVGYPEGFDPLAVFAQGALANPSAVSFQNMRKELGDPGLWRAGTGDPATFGTVDGYVYAIPLCAVFRRNSAAFSDVGNLAGAFNRNSRARSRTDAMSYAASAVLASDLTDAATSFSLSSISGTILATMESFGEAYFKLDDEIIRVTAVTQIASNNFTVSIDRAQLGTTARSHRMGVALVPYTVRPDGLFADQIALSDILDLRHSVADKFDYDSILKTNVMELLKGNLRSTWKRFGSTNAGGPVVLYGDRITESSVNVGGLSRLDAPDGLRRVFSDAVVTQRFNVPVQVPSNTAVIGDDLAAAVRVEPSTATVRWASAPPAHGEGNRLVGGYPSWWNGDSIRVEIAPFRVGLPAADADQVKFVPPSELADSVLVRFEGMTTDPNGGISGATSPSATVPHLPDGEPLGKKILRNGDGLDVGVDGSGNLVIYFQSGTIDTQLQEFADALQSSADPAFVQKVVMHVEFTVVYGAGRGLSHRPDWIHAAQYRGTPTNASRALVRSGLTDKTRMVPTSLAESPYVQTGNDRQYARTSEVMVDPGSKTVYVAPYRAMNIPPLLARNGDRLNWYGQPAEYQGAMPASDSEGRTTVHDHVDPLNLFYRGAQTRYVEVSMDWLPRPGLHHVPIVPTSNSVFSSGINFMLMAKEGQVQSTSDYNRSLVSYPANSAGYYVVTPQIGEAYGSSSGSYSIFGQKVSVAKLQSASGGPFRGIRFPPFLGPARITGVYARPGAAVVPAASPFSLDRAYVGAPESATNLLRDDFDGPTFLLDVNAHGDITFVLNADVLDLSRVGSGATFDNTDFLVECVLFGFDRGFLQTNGRLLVVRDISGAVAAQQFTLGNNVGIVAPAPLSAGAANNEITLYYSRVPYQGDPFGTQNAYSDDLQRTGPLTPGEAQALAGAPLGPVSTLTLPNKGGFEILAATSFTTSLGTGRLSGSSPIPLLNTVEAPANPRDYAGTRVDLNRKQSLNRVGYEDWAAVKWPVLSSALAARPPLKTGALSEVFDHDVHPELAGCTTHLPLGAYFRDKDFVGKTLYQARSTSGNGSIPVGTMSIVPFEASMAHGVSGVSSWEGTEFVCGKVSNTSGVGSEAIVRVDGTNTNPSSATVFKTTRGGAAYSITGPWPGGTISSRFPKSRPNSDVGSVLMGTAYLVRSHPEAPGGSEVHMGHELQMIVVTQAAPAYFRDSEIVHSASGAGEGYTAVDRFRIMGKPLEKRRGQLNITTPPSSKPLFVNKIYDDPVLFGSSDLPLTTPKQETLPVSSDGQVSFTLSARPADPTAVQMFVNGVKMQYGVDFTVGGTANTTLTYVASPPGRPELVTSDAVELWYLLH